MTMIEKKLYECSFCGRNFFSREACTEHEKRHAKPAEIAKAEYVSVEATSGSYPHIVQIKMNDGVTVVYRYSKIVK